MQAYSQDLRERVLRALDRGDGPTEIARRFEVSRVWVYQVRDRERETGERSSFQIGGHRRSRLAESGAGSARLDRGRAGSDAWPSCSSGWRNRACRSKSALCGTS